MKDLRALSEGAAGCYEKIRQQQSSEASAMAGKRTKAYCSDCKKILLP
jgi:hypothetical protein